MNMFRGVETAPLLTAEDVERMSLPGKRVELVRGRLVVREPPGTWHGAIAANVAYHLSDFVRRHQLGQVFGQDTGFKTLTRCGVRSGCTARTAVSPCCARPSS